MTPGEVKGYAKQAMKRKELSTKEKTAISLLLEMQELMLVIAPIVSKANKELENVRNNDDAAGTVSPRDVPEPNTGWKGDNVLPDRKGPK